MWAIGFAENITGPFFATSTGDAICVVRSNTAFLNFCDVSQTVPDQSTDGDDAVESSSEKEEESEEDEEDEEYHSFRWVGVIIDCQSN